MVESKYPRRRWSARMVSVLLLIKAASYGSEAAPDIALWQVTSAATSGGKSGNTIAVPLESGSVLVSILAVGENPQDPKVRRGNQTADAKSLGYDPVSRLQFIQLGESVDCKPSGWSDEIGEDSGILLTAVTATGSLKCHTSGWIKQVGGKILPLALLKVAFSGTVPPVGTPLVDSAGRIAAVVFQDAGAGNIGYAIPSQAVRRVQRDIFKSGKLVRGWLGLSLRAETQNPVVVRVLENSPAADAGIRPGDVISQIGDRKVSDYADAANAFFYLIPDESVDVKLHRGSDLLTFPIIPQKPASK